MKTPAKRSDLRAARPADAEGIKRCRCIDAAYRHYIPRMGKPPGQMLEDYAEVIRRHAVFVAEEAGETAGVLVLVETESGLLLDNVAVHPAHQGKGLGRLLLERAESEARERGYAHLELYTHECMTENIAWYKRNGYAETVRKTETEHGYKRVYMRKAW